MKKLALASVAFAAVSAFGAGNSFATTTFISSSGAVAWNDSADWTAGNATGVANMGASAATLTATTSVNSAVQGIGVQLDYTSVVSPGATNSLLYGLQGSGLNLQFPGGHPAMFGSSAGSLKVSFTKGLEAVGFFVSPAELGAGDIGSHYNVNLTIINGVGHSESFTYTGLSFDTSCLTASCTFVGAQASGSTIMAALFSITNSDVPITYAPAIDTVSMETETVATPEPASLTVLGVGLFGLSAIRRRRATTAGKGGPWGFLDRWRVPDVPQDKPPTT